MLLQVFLPVLGLLTTAGVAEPELHAAVLRESFRPLPGQLAERLGQELEDAGYTVAYFGYRDLCDAPRLAAHKLDLLALPDASALPVGALPVLHDWLTQGGDILAFNVPMARELLVEDSGDWLERAEWRKRHREDLLSHVLVPFKPGDIAGWERSAADMRIPARYEVIAEQESPSGRALHAWVSNHNGWDTFGSPPMDAPFPEGHTLTVFFAKGEPETRELSIEWREHDGSRWIATVPLSADWQAYVLQPSDFKFWQSVEARRGTQFDPRHAERLAIGLSNTHTNVGAGKHEYYVGAFGTAPRTPLHEVMLTRLAPPALDTLAPEYKFFPCRDVAEIQVRRDQNFVSADAVPMPQEVYSSHPRPRGAGFDKGRDWRWTPLLEASTADGEWRGTPATLLIHADGPYKGGVWAAFAIRDRNWYTRPEVLELAGQVAAKIANGVFILDGGSDHYTYFEEQDMRLGARVANLARKARQVRGEMRLYRGQDILARWPWEREIAPGDACRVEEGVPAAERGPGERWSAEAVLLAEDGETPLDSVAHEVHIWRPSLEPAYVTVKDGDFMLAGRRWRVHGVNYMPSSGIGIEDGPYFEYWLGARSYDPEVIQRDLNHIAGMGMNAVSIFIYRESLEAQNLLDLLRRLQAVGLKADLSLRPGTPLEFRWEEMRELLEYYRIAEHDCIYALDLAWEPMFGNHDERAKWDTAWREWIDERYGGIENAEADWSFQAPRDGQGRVTNPLNHWTVEDGPWRVLVAAYRRFLDTLLYEYYSRARALVRSVDANHLVSYRMTEAGDPTFRWGERIPHDWPYLSAAVDVLEPEAYGRIGDWERVRPGWFQHAYARCCAPYLPMMWKEAGVNEWATDRLYPSPDEPTFKASYYRDLYRMFVGSRCDGVFFWWYPGGYRVNENSDYGIINPDGSDRAVTRCIRKHARALLDGPSPAPIDRWIVIDRDEHPDGVAGIYDEVKEEFWRAVEDGETPGLRTEATGSTTADCPMRAVGNRPYNGKNPPKYVDGIFDKVDVYAPDVGWIDVEDHGDVTLPTGTPLRLRVTCTNLGEAAWLPPRSGEETGGVWITCEDAGGRVSSFAIPGDVPRFDKADKQEITLPAGSGEYILSFLVKGRCHFGPRFRFHVAHEER